jgi:PPM family protein phosphatase
MPHEQPRPPVDIVDTDAPPGAPSTPDAVGAPETAGVATSPVTPSAASAEQPPKADESSPDSEAQADAPSAGGDLEELVLPSLVRAPETLPSGAEIGPAGRLRVDEHLGTRGRVNLYAATWRQDDGQEIEVELREASADHAGLQRETAVLTAVQYGMLPRTFLTCEQDGRQYLAVDRLGGESLEQALAAGVPPEQAISLVLQLVQATRRLHRAGWALLGLTPADVTVGQPVRIAYLGQAGRIGEPPPQALHVAGYSAPELAHRETVSGKEDVYTLGAILYRALAGHPLPDSDVDIGDFSQAIRLPGGPQLLADVLTPIDDRLDLDALYRRLLDLKGRQAEVAVSLEVASATTVGLNPTRLVNEDSSGYAVWARTGAPGAGETALLCVADGMGGMEAGEVASQTAVHVVSRMAVETLWPDTGDAEPQPRLDPATLVRGAATAVHAAAQGRNLGTTITCVAVHDGELTLAHVGDTRAYLLRDGALTRLTVDHSLVAAMVASGVITADEAHGHPDSNKVLRSLGSQRELPAGYVDGLDAAFGAPSLRLEVGDVLMLCSDGVWGTVEDPQIQVILAEALDAQNAARALVDRALEGGAPDNATAVVARCVRRPAH